MRHTCSMALLCISLNVLACGSEKSDSQSPKTEVAKTSLDTAPTIRKTPKARANPGPSKAAEIVREPGSNVASLEYSYLTPGAGSVPLPSEVADAIALLLTTGRIAIEDPPNKESCDLDLQFNGVSCFVMRSRIWLAGERYKYPRLPTLKGHSIYKFITLEDGRKSVSFEPLLKWYAAVREGAPSGE